MHINQIKDSKFLKKEDVGRGILVTVAGLRQENVAMQGEAEDLKYILCFKEDVKPMVLNTTNARLIAGITGSEETDDWKDRPIVLYTDPTIAFAGKIVGGIRVRAPRNQPAPARPAPAPLAPRPAPAPAPAEPATPFDDDDVPF